MDSEETAGATSELAVCVCTAAGLQMGSKVTQRAEAVVVLRTLMDRGSVWGPEKGSRPAVYGRRMAGFPEVRKDGD